MSDFAIDDGQPGLEYQMKKTTVEMKWESEFEVAEDAVNAAMNLFGDLDAEKLETGRFTLKFAPTKNGDIKGTASLVNEQVSG